MIKYIYTVLAFFVLVCCLPEAAQAQKKGKKEKKVKVESRLVNEEGDAVSNATITLGEGLLKTFSNENGEFTLRTQPKGMLLIEAQGYKDLWIDLSNGKVAAELVLTKTLLFASEEDKISLPLGLKTDQRSLTGAVSKVSGDALETFPDLTFSNALQGRIMGLNARKTVNGLGNNSSALYSRGLSRGVGLNQIITVVDGVERSIDYLIAEEVESVELLKDATTKILYGPRAANGVLFVTTKRGRPNTRMLKTSIDYGASFVTRMPDYLNSYDYATLYNEARQNDGLSPFYSQADLQGYQNSQGVNDSRYPNVDYYDYFLKNSGEYRKASLEYSGGDQDNQYALVLGYVGGNGIEKVGKTPNLDRFILRGNLDIKVNDYINAKIGASGLTEKRAWGALNNSQAFSALSSHRPNEYPFIINDPGLQSASEDGTSEEVPPLGGSFHHPNNIYGSYLYGGFNQFETFYGQANMSLDFKLDDFVKGLSANVYYTIDNYQYFESGKSEVPVTYAQRWYTGEDGQDAVQYYQLRKRVIEDNQSRKKQDYYNTNGLTGAINYERTFGKHDFSANLTHFFFKKEEDDLFQDLKFKNTVLRLKDGFNNKIYTELTLAYMGSGKMPKKNRYKLFPAVGAAWIMSEEDFMKDNQFFDFLKLKGSFGIMGYDRSTDYYLYENRWNDNGAVRFNERNNTGATRTRIQLIGNPDLDWEKSREINVGFEGLGADKHMQFEFNYFNERRYDIIQSPEYRYSVTIGDLYPRVNEGETLNRGVEGEIRWSNTVGELQYSFGGNFVYSKNKIVKNEEVLYPEDYVNQTGKSSDAMFGYVAEGLYTDQTQVDGHPLQTFGEYGPGNISYMDLNNDGVVDELDRKEVGNSFPRTTLGIDFNLNYKGFGLYVLGTSELGVDHWLNNSYYWNRGQQKYSVLANNRWNAVNNPNGTYPALTTTTGSNDFRNSTFWLEDASFFRLKNVELSYTLPASSVARSYKFHLRGSNLFVLSKNKDLDPEVLDAGIDNYPVFRTITGGVSVSF